MNVHDGDTPIANLARRTVQVGQVDFSAVDMSAAVEAIVASALKNSERATAVRLWNAYCVVMAESDPRYLELTREGGVTLPDGAAVAFVMRMLRHPGVGTQASQVRGPTLFQACIARGEPAGIRHYFLGTTDDTMQRMLSRIAFKFPNAVVAGCSSPKFGPVDNAFLRSEAEKIRTVAPHIVWVGMGSPKQDFACTALSEMTNTMCIGVGAGFDYLAGTVKEAPRRIQLMGLEWLFRLCVEPRRLWRRYIVGNAKFIRIVYKQLIRNFESWPRSEPRSTRESHSK